MLPTACARRARRRGRQAPSTRWHTQGESANAQPSQRLALRQPECQYDPVDLLAAKLLTSPDGLALLATVLRSQLADRPVDPLAQAAALRGLGHPAPLVAVVLTQARLLTRLRQRWGDVPEGLLVTPDGAEQATRPVVANHRAARYQHALQGAATPDGVVEVIDLCSGIGLDALAFAQVGLSVDAFDIDAATVLIARHNADVLGLDRLIRFHEKDVQSLPPAELRTGAIFADPSRRSGPRRISDPESWSPPLSWVLSLRAPNVGVKVAPGIDRDRLPSTTEFEVVSVGGTVVEGGLYRGDLQTHADGQPVRRRATVFAGEASVPETITDADLLDEAPPVGRVGEFLHEPDGAVIRAGLVGVVVQRLAGRLVDHRIAYITNDNPVRSPLVTSYRVVDVQRFNLKKLRTSLHARGVGSVTIKKRGFAMTPEELRSALRLRKKDTGQATLVLTRIGDVPTVIEVESPDKQGSVS